MIVGLAVAAEGATVVTPPNYYAIAPVRSAIADEQVLGSLKAGMACLPAGKVRWLDLPERPDAAAEAVVTGLMAAGLTATTDRGNVVPEISVQAEVVALELDLCRPQYGMLKFGKVGLKGSGQIAVRWRVTRADKAAVREEVVTAGFTVRSPAKSLAPVLVAALEANALELGRRLSAANR